MNRKEQFLSAVEILAPGDNLIIKDALRVKSAEYWLKLGQPFQALCELDKLPAETRKHPWVLRVSVVAMGAVRGLHESSVHAE